MFRIFIIAGAGAEINRVQSELARQGFACTIAADNAETIERLAEEVPVLVLIEMTGPERIRELLLQVRQVRQVPIIALARREMLPRLDGRLEADDFVLAPYDISELVLRIRRLLDKTLRAGELVTIGDLVIDLAKCEVTVAGRLTDLTYREYELLKFLAGHPGRVYTREALLDRVWGYEFYGGDRTVDVHIRRLRSKIEDATHDFIETVRNIGYRIKEPDQPDQ